MTVPSDPLLVAGLIFAGVLLAVLAVFNRRAALYLVLPAIALSPDIGLGRLPVRVEDFLMVPLAAGWLANLCIVKERRRTPLDRLLLAYVGVAFAAMLWGGYLGTAHLDTLNKYFSAPFHGLKRVEFVLFFFVLVDTFSRPEEIRAYTVVMMLSLAGLSTFALVEYLSNGQIALAPAGAAVHEPGLATMINVALVLGLFPSARAPLRMLLAAIMAFSVAVLPLTLGRNFIMTTALMMLYVGLFQQRWVLWCLPAIALMGKFFYSAGVIARVTTLEQAFQPDLTGVQTHGASLISRVMPPGHYSLLALGYSPALGFGPGSVPLGWVDSEYATQLVYTGLVGFTVFVLLAVRLWRMAQAATAAAPTPELRGLARGYQLVLVAYAIHSIFSPSMAATRAGFFFFIVIGLLAVLYGALVTQEARAPVAGATKPPPGRAGAAGGGPSRVRPLLGGIG